MVSHTKFGSLKESLSSLDGQLPSSRCLAALSLARGHASNVPCNSLCIVLPQRGPGRFSSPLKLGFPPPFIGDQGPCGQHAGARLPGPRGQEARGRRGQPGAHALRE